MISSTKRLARGISRKSKSTIARYEKIIRNVISNVYTSIYSRISIDQRARKVFINMKKWRLQRRKFDFHKFFVHIQTSNLNKEQVILNAYWD